ncbi:MAG: class I SAM-dependent rRNA methyltransferase, partial [Clostridia bacterium]|nr:class I SAM-dependent rRNA methyltransferase [Clostridia bacterium]
WFEAKIKRAKAYRDTLDYGTAYRAIFAESDGLPGLIVDRYGDYLSVQFLCLGMDVRKDMIVDILVRVFEPLGIYERSDVSVREKEGLAQVTGLLYGEVPDLVEVEENGIKMLVDIKHGQKTGYFLDQKENRANIRRYARGKRVLDCFCNLGGFGLASASIAQDVTEVDISETALEVVRKTASLNGYANVHTVQADVFEFLREQKKAGEKYDLIVLDPPAFTKSKDTVQQAVKGYKDINILGLNLLAPGGVLVTCRCSQHLTQPLFVGMLTEAAKEAGVVVRLVELRYQARDHATMLGADEATYLKVAVLGLM